MQLGSAGPSLCSRRQALGRVGSIALKWAGLLAVRLGDIEGGVGGLIGRQGPDVAEGA